MLEVTIHLLNPKFLVYEKCESVEVLVATNTKESCVILCNLGAWQAIVYGDSPGKNTEVGCMPSSRTSSWPSDWTLASGIAGRFLTVWATREAPYVWFTINQVIYKKK